MDTTAVSLELFLIIGFAGTLTEDDIYEGQEAYLQLVA